MLNKHAKRRKHQSAPFRIRDLIKWASLAIFSVASIFFITTLRFLHFSETDINLEPVPLIVQTDSKIDESPFITTTLETVQNQYSRPLGHPPPTVMTNPAILILTYDRTEYLTQMFSSLQTVPGVQEYKIYISQDGKVQGVGQVIDKKIVGGSGLNVTHLQHFGNEGKRTKSTPKTMLIARHYGWALGQVFDRGHSHLIVLEDDMMFSKDFLELFAKGAELMASDETIFCVSSWNDYGHKGGQWDSSKLFRTEYFPGLGWMIRSETWHNEMNNRWPVDAWDYFMRLDDVMKGKDCLAPEISRNRNIGRKGSTMDNRWYAKHVDGVEFFSESADFGDMEYLIGENYEQYLQDLVSKASHVGRWPSDRNVVGNMKSSPEKTLLITFDAPHFKKLGEALGVIDNFRTYHRGTAVLKRFGKTIILADERVSPYISKDLFVEPIRDLQIRTGKQKQSCSSVCQSEGLKCDASQFPYVNKCSVLKKHFPCERDCKGGVVGKDVPNYIPHGGKPEFANMCLTTEIEPSCEASHATSMRICPCI